MPESNMPMRFVLHLSVMAPDNLSFVFFDPGLHKNLWDDEFLPHNDFILIEIISLF